MRWEVSAVWVAPYDAFLLANDPSSTPAGQCFEITIGTAPAPVLWAAYNPHAVATQSTRSHRLAPGHLVVEVDGIHSSIMGPAGGTDLDVQRGPAPADLATTFSSGVVTGYVPAPTEARFLASSKMIEGEKAITSKAAWETLAGIVTTIGFFLAAEQNAVGRVVGNIKTSGAGVELRLVRLSDGAVLTSTPFVSGDTANAWQTMQFSSDQDPGRVIETYILEGRLNAATSASIRFVSMSLLEITT